MRSLPAGFLFAISVLLSACNPMGGTTKLSGTYVVAKTDMGSPDPITSYLPGSSITFANDTSGTITVLDSAGKATKSNTARFTYAVAGDVLSLRIKADKADSNAFIKLKEIRDVDLHMLKPHADTALWTTTILFNRITFSLLKKK